MRWLLLAVLLVASLPSCGFQASEEVGACSDLDEATCRATPECRAAYLHQCLDDAPCAPQEGLVTFQACWSVEPGVSITGGPCDRLDADDCSARDDCAAVHDPAAGPDDETDIGTFCFCAAED
jgi:hypothetical protein